LSFVAATVAGVCAGYVLTWLLLRQTRRVAQERAGNVLDLAKREAQLAVAEMRSRAEE
jgi:ribonuclease Y